MYFLYDISICIFHDTRSSKITVITCHSDVSLIQTAWLLQRLAPVPAARQCTATTQAALSHRSWYTKTSGQSLISHILHVHHVLRGASSLIAAGTCSPVMNMVQPACLFLCGLCTCCYHSISPLIPHNLGLPSSLDRRPGTGDNKKMGVDRFG